MYKTLVNTFFNIVFFFFELIRSFDNNYTRRYMARHATVKGNFKTSRIRKNVNSFIKGAPLQIFTINMTINVRIDERNDVIYLHK